MKFEIFIEIDKSMRAVTINCEFSLPRLSLRTVRRGRNFGQICQLSQEKKIEYSNDLRWRIVYQRIAMNLPLVKIAQNLNVAVSTVHRIYRSMRHRKSFEYAVFLPGSADISDSNVQTSHLYALYANLRRIRVTEFSNGTAIDCR